jgi:PAS domain S-box-containing protein
MKQNYFGLRSIIQDTKSEEDNVIHFLKITAIAGLVISAIVLLYGQIFRSGSANLIADGITIILFTGMLTAAIFRRIRLAVSMVFLIPFLIYLYYLSALSIAPPPDETISGTLWWLISGTLFLVIFAGLDFRFLLFVISSFATIWFHLSEADRFSSSPSESQIWPSNPLWIYLITAAIAVALRYFMDYQKTQYNRSKINFERRLNETFQAVKQPAAVINAILDPVGDVIRLEVDKVNHAFESQFRISLQEISQQEVNYIFRYIFRNETNWNDLLIINPRQQTEIYPAHMDRWFTVNFYWLGREKCIILFSDISKDKSEIRLLQETERRHLALLEAIPDIFFVIDRDGTYQDIVFKGDASLHMEAGEVIGSTIFDVGFTENMARKIYECIQRAIQNDSIETIEYTLQMHEKNLLFEMRLVRLNENSVVSIARDITRRKKAEFELERAKTRAEEAGALKSRFLANLSHDIRTPMSIIISLTRMLGESGLTDYEREDYIQNIHQQGNQLLKMIDNTIHLSKIETNAIELNIRFCHINRLLKDLFNRFYPMLPDNRDIRLRIVTDIQHEEAGFETDPEILKEILEELTDNAIRFTEEGLVQVGYRYKNPSLIEFFVEDTGPGIPEEEIENIFLRFYVIEKDRRNHKSGPGTGLSICQHFVALLGGELRLETKPGKGSRFWFELPLLNPRGFMRIIQ